MWQWAAKKWCSVVGSCEWNWEIERSKGGVDKSTLKWPRDTHNGSATQSSIGPWSLSREKYANKREDKGKSSSGWGIHNIKVELDNGVSTTRTTTSMQKGDKTGVFHCSCCLNTQGPDYSSPFGLYVRTSGCERKRRGMGWKQKRWKQKRTGGDMLTNLPKCRTLSMYCWNTLVSLDVCI